MPAATPQQDQGITKGLKGGDVNIQVLTQASFSTAVELLKKFDLLGSTEEVKLLLGEPSRRKAGFEIQFNKAPSAEFDDKVLAFARQLSQSRI